MTERDLLETLREKLSPRRFPGMSGKMVAVLAYVLGVVWTEPTVAWLSVTSDGFVNSDAEFIGEMSEFERNFESAAILAGLDADEVAEFWRCWADKVVDWRPRQ